MELVTEHKCEDCGSFLYDGGPCGLYCVDDECNKRSSAAIVAAMKEQGLLAPMKPFTFPTKKREG